VPEPAREPIIARAGEQPPLEAMGRVFGLGEWMGSGPPQLHVHHADDEAWHVLEGEVEFRFAGGRREAVGPGTTVFVPSGASDITDAIARYRRSAQVRVARSPHRNRPVLALDLDHRCPRSFRLR
jgi:uncharacterized cupin superfamily protein